PEFYTGERLEILITYTEPAQLTFYNLPETSYSMDNLYSFPQYGLPVLGNETAPQTWTNVHSWKEYKPGLGPHTVIGAVNGYGSASTRFQVIPTPLPSGD